MGQGYCRAYQAVLCCSEAFQESYATYAIRLCCLLVQGGVGGIGPTTLAIEDPQQKPSETHQRQRFSHCNRSIELPVRRNRLSYLPQVRVISSVEARQEMSAIKVRMASFRNRTAVQTFIQVLVKFSLVQIDQCTSGRWFVDTQIELGLTPVR